MTSATTESHRHLLWAVFAGAVLLGVLEAIGHALGRDMVADSPMNFLRYALPAALTVLHATWVLGVRRGLGFVLALVFVGWVAEVVGLQCGMLFGGEYSYHSDAPAILGVPRSVPVFWAVFIYAGYSVTTSLLNCMGRDKPRVLAGRALFVPALAMLDGLIVVAIDLVLDPVAVRVQMWSWPDGGAYFGVPAGNFAGWFAVAAISTSAFRILEYAYPQRGGKRDGWTHLMPLVCYGVVCVVLILWAVRVRLGCAALVGFLVMALVPAVGLGVLSFLPTSQRGDRGLGDCHCGEGRSS